MEYELNTQCHEVLKLVMHNELILVTTADCKIIFFLQNIDKDSSSCCEHSHEV